MPVSMMMPMVGSSPNVSGSSSVMPASGPSPGSTPTTVPHKQPRKQYNRPFQESATAKPPTSWSNPVISPRSGRKLHSQQYLKEIPAARHAQACRGDRKGQPNASDQNEERNPEQPEREQATERLEDQR